MMTDTNIPDEVTQPEQRPLMGDALAALGRRIGLTNEDFDFFDKIREQTPLRKR